MAIKKRAFEIARRIIELESEIAPLSAELSKLRKEWDQLVPESSESDPATGPVSIKQRVLEYVEKSSVAVTWEMIQRDLGIGNPDTIRSCLSRLQGDKKIVAVARGQYAGVSSSTAAEAAKQKEADESPF